MVFLTGSRLCKSLSCSLAFRLHFAVVKVLAVACATAWALLRNATCESSLSRERETDTRTFSVRVVSYLTSTPPRCQSYFRCVFALNFGDGGVL
jgi:hypothetical protein